ncbi:PilZ domain-containing protein [Shewanella sp. CG12_big_fil_rev_8_21_14_0_65_47_15]|uniref:PilZ domain-containing protein n=1 Tax=Shewanella sp. CG12_big_fil_rev_8_21_14_0_65_47_15 TaxID=1975537 RepID=UPI000CB12530|nr:PilZ domain-containing protein [Shewanella sp. CG12_big_fil_rev_8_21_14_0_65_47_15]PIW58956.1 MAG: PilZ domain-containing protein [Shewanella sp. CG12_big_fil_rev_8_21_14_0_65_47_15]
MSLDNHSALIEQLKPLLMEPNFQEIFQQLTIDETNSTRFLLKMELNRLASPCTRIIDLRDKSELPCTEVMLGQQRHFLDEPAKHSLFEAMSLYRNQYTLGVYEYVLTAHQQRRQKLRQGTSQTDSIESEPFMVPGVVLGSYFNRAEERMNYSIRITASQMGRGEIPGITVDLSIGGARIRLAANHPFDLDKPLKVKLLELSEEYYYPDLQLGVDYQIVDSQTNGEFIWLRLKRIGGTDALGEMLGNLIRGYKLRYKLDVNDVLVTASGLGFERHYLPHLPHLPLFINQQTQAISHMLLSRDNQQIVHYFQDENDISQLPAMLTQARLSALLAHPENPDHGLFFSFTYNAQGCLYFYSATLAELKAKGLMPLFLGFASTKPSWRIFKLTQDKIYHEKGYRRATLPGDETKYNPLVEQQLSLFSHMLQLVDLTNEDARLTYNAWQDNSNANALKAFGQQRLTAHTIKPISMQFSERRQEARFAFKTLVNLSQGELRASGITLDISSRGMQLTLDNPTAFSSNKPLMLSLPKLQAIAGKTQLEHLPYRLVRTRKNGVTLHLTAVMGHTPHVGVEFLNKLIAHNKEKLEQLTENNSEVKELADGLKNILLRELHSVPYFIEKTTKSAQVACLGVGTQRDDISDIFAAGTSDALQYNLAPLLKDGFFKREILEPIRQMKPQQDMDFIEVFIQLTRQSRGQIHLKCVLASEVGDAKAKVAFINQSKMAGRFIALRIYRGATEKPDISYLRRELEYINVHANHRAKQLEEQLWRIIGVGELLDITQEVELRYPVLHQKSA